MENPMNAEILQILKTSEDLLKQIFDLQTEALNVYKTLDEDTATMDDSRAVRYLTDIKVKIGNGLWDIENLLNHHR